MTRAELIAALSPSRLPPSLQMPGWREALLCNLLERIAELIPTEWLDAVAKGSPQDCAKTIARQYDLGVHSVIMHGASPHELAPVVEAYRADRPTLHRAVAANPGRFA